MARPGPYPFILEFPVKLFNFCFFVLFCFVVVLKVYYSLSTYAKLFIFSSLFQTEKSNSF